jgi:hypothetical protein
MPRKTLPSTKRLTQEGDFAAEMVAGISRYLTRETETARQNRDTNTPQDTRREHLSEMLGLMDERENGAIQIIAPLTGPTEVATAQGYRIFEVRWPSSYPMNHPLPTSLPYLTATSPPNNSQASTPTCPNLHKWHVALLKMDVAFSSPSS